VRGAHPTKPMCHHLAVKGERPTKKVKPKAHKRKPTKKQCGITIQIRSGAKTGGQSPVGSILCSANSGKRCWSAPYEQ
jgi:hypothetical protein